MNKIRLVVLVKLHTRLQHLKNEIKIINKINKINFYKSSCLEELIVSFIYDIVTCNYFLLAITGQISQR